MRQALLAQREGARIVGGSYAAQRHSLTLAEGLAGVIAAGRFHRGRRAPGTSPSSATSSARPLSLEQQGLTDDARDRLTFPGTRQTYPQLFSTPAEEILTFDDRLAFGLGLILGGLREQIPGMISPEDTPTLVSENISPLSPAREAPATRLSPTITRPLRSER